MGCAKRGVVNGQTPFTSRATKQTARKAPSLWVAAKCGVCVVLAEAWSSVRATAEASAGPRNHNPASHVPLRCTASQVQRCAGPPRLRSAPRTRSRAAWCGQGRRRLRSIAWSGACAAAPASGPWANGSQPRYDLRRAPRIHPHFTSNAIRGGLNQRLLSHFCRALRARVRILSSALPSPFCSSVATCFSCFW
jgi:hypothetical protein